MKKEELLLKEIDKLEDIEPRYKDIINLDPPLLRHKRMPIENRAAIFAPFQALKGLDDEFDETSRLTNERKELDDGLKMILNSRLNSINDNPGKDIISFTYFVSDKKKSRGKYITSSDYVKKIDLYKKQVILKNKIRINIDDIINITSDTFSFDN